VKPSDALTALTDALRAHGLRVALRPGDLTPPCVLVQLWGPSDTGELIDPLTTTFVTYAIPLRGTDDTPADCALMDTVIAALSPVTLDAVTFTRTTVTVTDTSWPCYRADAVV